MTECSHREPAEVFAAQDLEKGILMVRITCAFLLLFAVQAHALDQQVLFRSGEEGYDTFRIPAVITLDGGAILAFCEGRKDSRSDAGNIDVVLKRSSDGGKSWTPLQIVADMGPDTIGNPAPILFFNPASTTRENMTVRISLDDAKTWPSARSIHVGPAAYSDLATYHGAIYCLYERGDKSPYETITLATLTRAWIKSEDTASTLPPLPDGQAWSLVWNDEFDGDTIDDSKWEIVGDHKRRDHWWVKEDSSLDGQGHLVIRTQKDGERFTSGAVRTRGKYERAFGYFEARCKFPTMEGHWPAFWLYGPGVGTIGNDGRDGTEIDIMEKPSLQSGIQHALHWDGYGDQHRQAGRPVKRDGLNEGFHTFALWWSPEEYVFYVDGEETWRTKAGGVSQVPTYIKLTEEIGDWAGDITKAALPDYFLVDYVRVYEAR